MSNHRNPVYPLSFARNFLTLENSFLKSMRMTMEFSKIDSTFKGKIHHYKNNDLQRKLPSKSGTKVCNYLDLILSFVIILCSHHCLRRSQPP